MKRPIPGLPIEQQPPDVLLVMLAYGEARNQSAEGILGVISVVINRAYGEAHWMSQYMMDNGKKIAQVILKPWQFSSFNENDPNRAKMLDAWKEDPYAWGRCWGVVELVLAGGCDDPTVGASHYCTKALWDNPGKKWFQHDEIVGGRTVKTVDIGDHVFARAAGSFV